MSTPLKTYDLASVFLLIGGYQIGGFGEDGAVSFEYGKPVASAKVGGDGQAVVSRNNDYSMTATITVMESSKSYKDLFTLYSAQQEEEAFERLEFRMEDEINGDKVADQYCAFLELPAPNKARSASEREFKVFLPNARKTLKLGNNITV